MRLESYSYSLPGWLLSLSRLHPHVLHIASWLPAALDSIPLVQECPSVSIPLRKSICLLPSWAIMNKTTINIHV